MAFDEQDVPAAAGGARPAELLGLQHAQLLQPAPALLRRPRACRCTSSARSPTRCTTPASACCSTWCSITPRRAARTGPTINFKGLANEIFYHLDAADRRRYRDYTGCGNTVNCNHPLVTAFIVHCLEYWVEEMGVDGFRFDLASVFARDAARRADGRSAGALGDRVLAHPLARAADRRGLGRGRPLSRRRVPGDGLGGMERPLPRRDAPLRPRRSGTRRRGRHPHRRQRRSVRRRRPAAGEQHQLRHLSRRLHAARSGELQRQAQRGQRRGQPRRDQRQRELELRRRGRDVRSRGESAAPAAGEEPRGDPHALARRADAARGRRGAADARQATTTPGARTTRFPGSTGGSPKRTATCCGSRAS